MDPAEQVEACARARQAPMEAALRGGGGGSLVREYYRGVTVLLTGGTGFIGKQLIEKLFRSCAIKKMYLLTRAKKGRTIHERVQHMLTDPVFDVVREQQLQFVERLEALEGDVADVRLGLSDKHWHMLAEEVEVIFHAAAIVRFDEALRAATLTNVRGTREVLALATQCTKLKKLVHVSTAFVHATTDRTNTEVLETFYPCPISPDTMIQLAETVEPSRLDNITPGLIQNWLSTYTFTKALAEELIRSSAGDLPVCIVRPPIVLPASYEPSPGWLDMSTIMGPSGIYLGQGLGVLRVLCVNVDTVQAVCPVDYVNNAIIAAACYSDQRVNNGTDVPIYTIRRKMRYGDIYETGVKEVDRLACSRAVWSVNVIHTTNKPLYWVLSLFLHYIPAYILDFACTILRRKPKGITSFVNLYKKVDKLQGAYDYFLRNDWDFKDNNLQAMIERMSAEDKAIFNCDVMSIDMYEYILVWAIGLRKYIIKDGLKNSKEGVKKQKMFRIANYFFLALYGYAFWVLYRVFCIIVENIVKLF